jgi:hypothetical protein
MAAKTIQKPDLNLSEKSPFELRTVRYSVVHCIQIFTVAGFVGLGWQKEFWIAEKTLFKRLWAIPLFALTA